MSEAAASESIIFGLSLTQLLPLIIALTTIATVIVGVFRFLMKHVTREAVSVRKEMTDKLVMHERNLNQSSDRIVDRQREIQSMIELLNSRISEIKHDVSNTVVGVKHEIKNIEEEVTKNLDFKQAEIHRIQSEIQTLRHEFQKLELENARRMNMSEDRADRSESRANLAENKAQHAESKMRQHMQPSVHNEGRPHGDTDETDNE